MQLTMPHVYANNFRRAAREQNVGKAAGGGANIEAKLLRRIEAEGIKRGGKLDAAPRYPGVGGSGFDVGAGIDRLGCLAKDLAVNANETGRDRFLCLGPAYEELAFDKSEIGAFACNVDLRFSAPTQASLLR
jgi:hypothetical protein